MSRVHRNYCLECEWSASERELSRAALATAAIEHVVEVGHDIDSERVRADGHDHYDDSDGDDPETVILFWDE